MTGEKFEEILDRYGFKEPPPVKRKLKVSFAGKEAIMTYPEFLAFSQEIGPVFNPIITEEIKEEA